MKCLHEDTESSLEKFSVKQHKQSARDFRVSDGRKTFVSGEKLALQPSRTRIVKRKKKDYQIERR
jgi:hypothetical protein